MANDLAIIEGAKITSVSLAVPKKSSFEDWLSIGRKLKRCETGVMWWVGDWWRFGEHKYGERLKALEDDDSLPALQTCMNAGSISAAFETSRRREVLSWSHHAELAALPERQQENLLDEAEESGWSTRDMRRAARRKKAEVNYGAPNAFPKGKYRVLYADPPWEYGNEQPEYHTEQADHYALMSIEEIAAMPVIDLVTDDAVLFLWVTSPILEESFMVVNSWGFSYKASFVWDKIKHNMGHYNSVRHEILLVCVRGSCTPDVQKLFDSVQSIERTEHSAKPKEFREIIDTLYPNGPRIELFARSKVDGWESYGNVAV